MPALFLKVLMNICNFWPVLGSRYSHPLTPYSRFKEEPAPFLLLNLMPPVQMFLAEIFIKGEMNLAAFNSPTLRGENISDSHLWYGVNRFPPAPCLQQQREKERMQITLKCNVYQCHDKKSKLSRPFPGPTHWQSEYAGNVRAWLVLQGCLQVSRPHFKSLVANMCRLLFCPDSRCSTPTGVILYMEMTVFRAKKLKKVRLPL